MVAKFVSNPSDYYSESLQSSRLWHFWLPLTAFALIPQLAFYEPEFFDRWLASERTGLLEFVHFLLPLLTAIIALRLLCSPIIQQDRWLVLWCSAMAIGGIYLSGEEASWGQHYIGWSTPEFWQQVNDQQETNLHNVSNLLDQLPRAILQAGIVITGTLYPVLLLTRPGFLPRRFNFLYPPVALAPLATLVAACWGYRALHKYTAFGDFLTYRPGEFQELFIVWFLFYYALFLLWREQRERQEQQQRYGSKGGKAQP